MRKIIDISKLMKCVNIKHRGKITITEKMSGLEKNPEDDWLYLGLLSLCNVSKRMKVTSMAAIGSGNGIETIAALKIFPELKTAIVTDILREILPQIRFNIEKNAANEIKRVKIQYVAGRDCLPLTKKLDLIYANLPLIMVSDNSLKKNLATTTLTDATYYLNFGKGKKDPLMKYSLLSQLGFLSSAGQKLKRHGIIITLLGGRIPYHLFNKLFRRANLRYKQLYCAFKRQSDPKFLKQYARYEEEEKIDFIFYDYSKASKILKDELNIRVPGLIRKLKESELKKMLKPAQINARQAYKLALQGKYVGHIAFAFEATKI